MLRSAPQGRHVALLVAYRGDVARGFQQQPDQRTVQGLLERALGELAGTPVMVRGAGRTDAGVHAAGQVVDTWLPSAVRVPTDRLPAALQPHLPGGLAVAAAWPVDARFHPRYSALGKRYRYLIWRAPAPSPFWAPYAWHYHGRLDVPAMGEAARAFVGCHDFRAYAGSARPVRDARRIVSACEVWARGPWLAVEIEAEGFLYRMARSIAGTLWRVGRGDLQPGDVGRILEQGQRAAAGPTLPAHGLCLLFVRYPPEAGLPAPETWPRWSIPPGPPPPDGSGSAGCAAPGEA